MQLVEPRPNRPMPIRITPLIDVVFILLVFFMLTSRLLPVDHLELANQTANTSPSTGDPIPEIRVLSDGAVEWDGNTLSLSDLGGSLRSQNITEVNVSTASETALSDFTQTLSTLRSKDITAHWKRENAPGSQP
ncbi:ExbD/TolR family protein [Marinobacter sp.]|uniref:ExbD/TolR family protein n=1 Tax=Marinobacter sp. TaxID=50741 RepID=UPI0034A41BA3